MLTRLPEILFLKKTQLNYLNNLFELWCEVICIQNKMFMIFFFTILYYVVKYYITFLIVEFTKYINKS